MQQSIANGSSPCRAQRHVQDAGHGALHRAGFWIQQGLTLSMDAKKCCGRMGKAFFLPKSKSLGL